MSISIDTYCLQCLLRRNIALAQTLGTEEQAMAFAKEIMKLYLSAPEGVSSPWFGPKIADLLHDMYGLDYDRFRQEKLDSNRFVLERLPAIRPAQRTRFSRDCNSPFWGIIWTFPPYRGRSALKSWRKCWIRRWKWRWMSRCTLTFAGICAGAESWCI